MHGQRVGHGRGLQVHIETAIKVRGVLTVNQPAACPVSLKQPRAESGPGPPPDPCAAGCPARIQFYGVLNDPGIAVLDRSGPPLDPPPTIASLEVDHFEAGAGTAVPPRSRRGQSCERHADGPRYRTVAAQAD